MRSKIERIKLDKSNFRKMLNNEKSEKKNSKLIELMISYLKMKNWKQLTSMKLN